MESTVKLDTQEAALAFVDTVIRKNWEPFVETNLSPMKTDLGQAAILEKALSKQGLLK